MILIVNGFYEPTYDWWAPHGPGFPHGFSGSMLVTPRQEVGSMGVAKNAGTTSETEPLISYRWLHIPFFSHQNPYDY